MIKEKKLIMEKLWACWTSAATKILQTNLYYVVLPLKGVKREAHLKWTGVILRIQHNMYGMMRESVGFSCRCPS